MHRIGGNLLEKLLNLEDGHQGQHIDCGAGHQAELVSVREKYLTTVLAPVHLRRAYYHCPTCHRGRVPRDEELEVVGTSLSPGVRRMTSRVGSQEAFRQGSRDLEPAARPSQPVLRTVSPAP